MTARFAHLESRRSILSETERIVITGMSINTPLGDTLDGFLSGLLQGRSALSNWKKLDVSRCYSKVGADLSDYNVGAKMRSLEANIPPEVWRRAHKLISKVPWATKLSILMGIDVFLDSELFDPLVELDRVAVIVAGHNINFNYQYENRLQF